MMRIGERDSVDKTIWCSLAYPTRIKGVSEKRTHMADLPLYRDSREDTGIKPGTPRWVKVFGIIVIVLVLLVGIIMFTGLGGEHGPGRHMPGGDTRPSSGQENTGGVGGPVASSASARTVEVSALDTMAFEPSRRNLEIVRTCSHFTMLASRSPFSGDGSTLT